MSRSIAPRPIIQTHPVALNRPSAKSKKLHLRKSQRPTLSCTTCVRYKTKCNKIVPCDRCVDRGRRDECHREVVLVKGKPTSGGGFGPPAQSASTFAEISEPSLPSILTQQSRRRKHGLRTDQLAGVLEEMALGIGNGRKLPGTGNTGVASRPTLSEHSSSSIPWFHPIDIDNVTVMIPNQSQSLALVSFFTEDLAWLSGAIHVPTFLAEHDAFWSTSNARKVIDDIWLALYMAVLSIAGYFMEESQAILNGFVTGHLQLLAKAWFDRSLALIFRSNSLYTPSLMFCQTVQTLTYAFHLSLNSASHSMFYDLCLRQARQMNLHRLDPEDPGVDRPMVIADEIGRRIWWNIVEANWSFLPYNCYTSINPKHFNTAVPLRICDEGLASGAQISVQQIAMTYRIACYNSASVLYKLYGELVVDEEPSYHAVMEASADMDRIIANLLPEFGMEAERSCLEVFPGNACARRLIGMTLAHRKYTIHRSYYIKSFRDPKFSASRTACVQSARDILEFAQDGLPSTFYRLWDTSVWLVAAGIVLVLNVLQTPLARRKAVEVANVHSTLWNLVKLLEATGDVTGIARRGGSLIANLLHAEETQGDVSSKRVAQKFGPALKASSEFTSDDMLELIRLSEGRARTPPPWEAILGCATDGLGRAVHGPGVDQEVTNPGLWADTNRDSSTPTAVSAQNQLDNLLPDDDHFVRLLCDIFNFDP